MIPLREVVDRAVHGGKAVALGQAMRAGLPVPDGFALSHARLRAVLEAPAAHEAALAGALAALGAVAVRSSGVDEDGAVASFAGQHATVLGVASVAGLLGALATVEASGRSPGAAAYRARLGLATGASIAVIVQRLVPTRAAGVLFTRDPVSGDDRRIVEASWGLGEAVVAGLVVPDRFELDRGGAVRLHALGDKDVEVVAEPGGARPRPVDEHRRRAPCLDADDLAALARLAGDVERAFPDRAAHDLEFARDLDGRIWLLQRRDVTA